MPSDAHPFRRPDLAPGSLRGRPLTAREWDDLQKLLADTLTSKEQVAAALNLLKERVQRQQRAEAKEWDDLHKLLAESVQKDLKTLNEIADLEASYRFPRGTERNRLIRILFTNARAVAVLEEASIVLQSFFGQGVQLLLLLDRDPEDGFEKVFATVQTSHPPEIGLQLMTEFDQKWWLERVPEVEGELNFVWEPSA